MRKDENTSTVGNEENTPRVGRRTRSKEFTKAGKGPRSEEGGTFIMEKKEKPSRMGNRGNPKRRERVPMATKTS